MDIEYIGASLYLDLMTRSHLDRIRNNGERVRFPDHPAGETATQVLHWLQLYRDNGPSASTVFLYIGKLVVIYQHEKAQGLIFSIV